MCLKLCNVAFSIIMKRIFIHKHNSFNMIIIPMSLIKVYALLHIKFKSASLEIVRMQ